MAAEGYQGDANCVDSEQGQMAIVQVNLFPQIVFSGEKQPDEQQLQDLHHKAHQYCFIANSVCFEVKVN